ncbi:MAG: hypothetical protein ACR2IE_10750 [Candidatus Sumerlaeaceae bacterium]
MKNPEGAVLVSGRATFPTTDYTDYTDETAGESRFAGLRLRLFMFDDSQTGE